MTGLIAALALLANPSVHPWPIGPGPRYTPPARPATVAAGRPVGPLSCGAPGPVFQLHVELFVNRKVVVLPAGIGVADPAERDGASVTPGGCSYPLRTLAPTGVVEVARGAKLRVADLFRVWGERLGEGQLASFSSERSIRAYVGGRLVRGPAGAIPLTPHAQIVIELGAFVPPHPFFLFTGGDS
jgi:hypothetical protein